jgi:FkbM family methyltransferase
MAAEHAEYADYLRMPDTLRATLRTIRDLQARTIAGGVAAAPALEPLFVAAGRRAALHSHLLGGLYWHAHTHLIEKLRQSGRRFRRVTVRGIPLDVDVTDRTGRLHFFHDEPYEPEVAGAIADALTPGDVFVDIGANIGYFSVLAACIVGPTGKVIAFEPHPGAPEELRILAERNHVLHRIDIVALALSNAEGEASLHLDDTFTSYSTLDPSASPMRASAAFSRSVTVRTTTFDSWVEAQPGLLPRIGCIKIDVEGAEAAVLTGMSRTLGRLRARIVCETSVGSAADEALLAAGFVRRSIEPGTYGNHVYGKAER